MYFYRGSLQGVSCLKRSTNYEAPVRPTSTEQQYSVLSDRTPPNTNRVYDNENQNARSSGDGEYEDGGYVHIIDGENGEQNTTESSANIYEEARNRRASQEHVYSALSSQ